MSTTSKWSKASKVSVRPRKWLNEGKKSGGAWQVDFSLTSADGTAARKRFNFEGTKADAYSWGEKARDALLTGESLPPKTAPEAEEPEGSGSFAAFAEEFLKTRTVHNKPSERRQKEIIVRKRLIPFFGAMKLHDIGAREIDAFTTAMRENEGLSAKTVNNYTIVLRTMLTTAVEYGRLRTAPKVKRLKFRDPDIRAFTPEQADRLLDVIDPAWRVMLLVALRTGLRIGELRALRWQDVDLSGRKLHVRQAFSRKVLGTPKSGKPRTVELSSKAVEALRHHPRVLRSEYVFCQSDGAPFREHLPYVALHAACKTAGVGTETGTAWTPGWHTCRHSFISWLVMEGVPLPVVQHLAGHANIKTTMRYAHLAPSASGNAVERLDECHKKSVTKPDDESKKTAESRRT